MPRTFLVATDLSPRADRAVQRAFRLSAWLGARLILVTVIDEDLPSQVAQTLAESAELRLAQFAASVPYSGDVSHDTRIVIGDPAETLPKLAAELGAELMVVGLHRPRAFLDMLRETTMERIVRHSNCPVLVVHDPVDHAYGKVLAALDFAPASTAALDIAADLAPEAELYGVHALHIPYHGFVAPHGTAGASAPFLHNAELRLKEWREAGHLPERLGNVAIVEGAVHMVLDHKIAELKPDLVTLGAHGRAGAAPSLLGSLANDMMRNPPCDLLIAR